MHEIKRFLHFLLIALLVFSTIGCSKKSIENSAKITPPENYDIAICGDWIIQKSYVNNYSIDDKNINNKIGKIVSINKDKVQLINKTCVGPSFKIKTVDSTSYLVSNYGISPSSLEINQSDIQVITITNKDIYFASFIKLNNNLMIATLDNNFFLLSRKTADSKNVLKNQYKTAIDEKNNIHDKIINANKSLSTYDIGNQLNYGLLLGLKSYNINSNKISYGNQSKLIKEPVYRTIWISLGNNSIKNTSELPYLLLARKNGFWNVKTQKSINNGLIRYKTLSYPIPKNLASDSSRSDIIGTGQAYTLEDILFIADDYVSLELNSGGISKGQSHEEKALRVRPIDTLNGTDYSISLSKLMGEHGVKALKQGAAAYINSLDFKEREKLNYIPDENNFGVIRKNGKWVLRGRLNYSSEAFRGSFSDFDIPIIPPKELVQYDSLYPNWNIIKEKIPDAIDAYSSPDRNFLVILTKYKLLVYNMIDNKISDKPLKVLNLKNNETVVMSQWATGDYVKSWDEQVKKLIK